MNETQNKGARIRLTKFAAKDNALIGSATWNNYKQGLFNTLSPPVDYFLEGHLIGTVTVGESLEVNRYMRNDELIPGYFQSSKITAMRRDEKQGMKYILETMNSVYSLEYLPDEI